MKIKKKILLTGGSGTLGSRIIESNIFNNLISPSKRILNIKNSEQIISFINDNNISSVIHCAASARMKNCEKNPMEAINVNLVGTANLVNSVLEFEKKENTSIRFIYISSDGVYSSIKGNYSEKSSTIPYNNYGWSKLGGECAVRLLSNYCIIRTRFFEPNKIAFDEASEDIFTSSIPIDDLVNALELIHNSDFTGVINIGGKKLSDYKRYKNYKPKIKPCKREDLIKELGFALAKDSSMDCSLWYNIKQK